MRPIRDAFRRALHGVLARPGRTALAAFGLGLGAAAVLELVGALDPEVRSRRLETPRISVLTASAHDRTSSVPIVAMSADATRRAGLEIAEGRLLADLDVRDARRVAVLGAGVRAELFGSRPTLFERVEIGDARFTVVGVLAAGTARAGGGDLDRSVLVPASAAPEALASVEPAAAGGASGRAAARRRAPLDLTARGLLAASSLLLGGAVLAAAMQATGLERAREIAVRRLVGATRREVFGELWLESVLVALLGGAAGVLAGLGLHEIQRVLGPMPPVELPIWGVPFALVLAVGIGAAAGLAPARRAAHLDPTRTLRGE
jgi:putative ABC transport system permease protein